MTLGSAGSQAKRRFDVRSHPCSARGAPLGMSPLGDRFGVTVSPEAPPATSRSFGHSARVRTGSSATVTTPWPRWNAGVKCCRRLCPGPGPERMSSTPGATLRVRGWSRRSAHAVQYHAVRPRLTDHDEAPVRRRRVAAPAAAARAGRRRPE